MTEKPVKNTSKPAEDWKGEHLISVKPTARKRQAETNRVINTIYHAKRRAKGAPAAGAKKHSGLMRAILSED